jgi:hypothetical protein
MRRAAIIAAATVLVAGPTVLAFFTGGYFDGPRAAATGIVWALVLALAVDGRVPLPYSTPGRIAAAALAALAAWTALSVAWAPLVSPAVDSAQRDVLYLGALLAATALLRDHAVARLVEPALAAGALVVIAYGLAGRLLPSVVELDRSFFSGGRLEQPLTYWNAEGLLAGMGLLLCVRVAGDLSRRLGLRAAAAAACAPLGMGLSITYSRGALAVTVLGLVVLLAAVPTRAQLRALLVGAGAGTAAALAALPFRGVAELAGSPGAQRRDGAIVLALLIAIAAVTAAATVLLARAERAGGRQRLRLASHLPGVVGAAALACVAGLVVGGLVETTGNAENVGANPSRFASVDSLRYEYWAVGADAFLESPLTGEGSGSFRVLWRHEREVDTAGALEVHSLVMEMAAELGLPGLLLLGLFVGGVAVCARAALRAGSPLAPAATAVCVAWLMHASFDWDWQMPAVTLPALILAGGLIAGSETVSAMSRGSARAPGPRAARRAP